MNISEYINTVDYNNIDLAKKDNANLILEVRDCKDNIKKLFSKFKNNFKGGELNYNFNKNPYLYTVDFYSKNDFNYFSLIFEYYPDFSDADFVINNVVELTIENIDDYSHSLRFFKKFINNAKLKKLSIEFILEYKNILDKINKNQKEILSNKLCIQLNNNKNKFKLDKIEQVFRLNKDLNIQDVLNSNSDIPILSSPSDDYKLTYFDFFTYKFNLNYINFIKHRIKVLEKDNTLQFFYNDKEILESEVNEFIKHSITYRNKTVTLRKTLININTSLLNTSKKTNLIISYDKLIKALKTDFDMINIKDF